MIEKMTINTDRADQIGTSLEFSNKRLNDELTANKAATDSLSSTWNHKSKIYNSAKPVLLLVLLAFIFGITGCAKNCNIKEDKVKFSTYTQEERKDYIKDYFQKNYQLNCYISDVHQKQINVFENEDNYFATAKTENNELISVWVSADGEITDALFMLDMNDEITDFFKTIVGSVLTDFRIESYTDMVDIPSCKLTDSANIENFLHEEGTDTTIRIFVDDVTAISDSTLDELQKSLNFCNCTIYLYSCNDLVNIDSVEFSSYVNSISIEKNTQAAQ